MDDYHSINIVKINIFIHNHIREIKKLENFQIMDILYVKNKL
jgi:hypothetical protein